MEYFDGRSSDRSSVGLANCRKAPRMPRHSHNLRLLGAEQRSGICQIDYQDSAAVDAP